MFKYTTSYSTLVNGGISVVLNTANEKVEFVFDGTDWCQY